MVAVSRNTCISISTPLPRKNIYYLLSLIHYLLSEVPGCANDFCPSAPLGLLLSCVTKVTKRTLWVLRRKRESKWRLCGGKAAFRFHCAYTLAECKTLLAETSIRYFFKPHSVMVYSQIEIKTTFLLLSSRGFLAEEYRCLPYFFVSLNNNKRTLNKNKEPESYLLKSAEKRKT